MIWCAKAAACIALFLHGPMDLLLSDPMAEVTAKRRMSVTEKKMQNPYYILGEAFVGSVVAGNRGKLTSNQIGLSDRLRKYAYYVTENAVEAGDALLANDLLDAARQLERAAVVTSQE